MSGTGWTWQHVRHECDLPTYFALCDWWQEVPSASVQLRRIASFLGLKPEASPGTARMASGPVQPSSPAEAAAQAAMAGMPVFDGRPADPMLRLLDDLISPPAATPQP